MNRSLEYSFKARLRNIANERRITPAELWETVVLERFLVRVAKSRFSDHFILKGGMLLSSYVSLGRHTQDLDFLVQRLPNRQEDIIAVVNEIISVPIDDGFSFADLEMRPLTHPHMQYSGLRATMRAHFGKARFKVVVDMGYGDLVTPMNRAHPLIAGSKGPLFEAHVEIPCYPQEFIVAEKLEAAIFLGGKNSRMKDFHDIYRLIQAGTMGANTEQIIRSVFEHRGTEIKLPITFTRQDYSSLQVLWDSHVQALSDKRDIPSDFASLIEHLNSWLCQRTSLCVDCERDPPLLSR